MNIKTLFFYKVPHPLKENRDVIVTDSTERTKFRNYLWETKEKKTSGIPRAMRFYISAGKNTTAFKKEEIKLYLLDIKKKEDRIFNRLKLKETLRLFRSFALGYLLYIAPTGFWEPIEGVFDAVAHGLSDYAKWWVILFFPVKGFIRCFGTGIRLPLPAALTQNLIFRHIPLIGKLKNIGTTGRWNAINRNSASTGIYTDLDKNLGQELLEHLNKEIDNIEKKIRKKQEQDEEASRTISELRKLRDNLDILIKESNYQDLESWNNDFIELLEKASDLDEGIFPRGEIPKLDMIREDILYFGINNNFIFSEIIDPGDFSENEHPAPETDYQSENLQSPDIRIKKLSALNQNKNLDDFLNKPGLRILQKNIYSAFNHLNDIKTREDGIEILEKLSSSFAIFRNEICRYHMGPDLMIPNEKGKALKDYYHWLYLIFGKAAIDLENKYRRASWGFRTLRSQAGVRKRIRMAVDEALYFIENKSPSRSMETGGRIITFFGKTAFSGIAAAAFLLFIFGSLFSFYILKPDETAITRSIRLGYQGKFFNSETASIEYGSGVQLPGEMGELSWHMPSPLTELHKLSPFEPSEFRVHMVIGESTSENPWKKFLKTMSGQLGLSFDVAELDIEFTSPDPEIWKNYNSDGKAYKRLIRDTSSIIEEWKSDLLSSYSNGLTSMDDSVEINHIFTTYFRELSEKGAIEDYIRRVFSQTAMSTHIYYGSNLERFRPGFTTLIDEFENRAEKSKEDPYLSEDEKTEIERTMTQAKEIAEETLKEVESKILIEYGELRRQPDRLLEMVKNPYMNIEKLRNFESLWSGIQSYTWTLYNQEKLKKIFMKGSRTINPADSSPKEDDYILDLITKLNEDPHIGKLINIRSIRFRVLDMGISQLNIIQQKWKDII